MDEDKDISNNSEWPPSPNKFRGEQSEGEALTVCPHCSRKLLSTRSILCNWCGKRIDDADYLARAAHERAMEDARMRDRVDKELDETVRNGIVGRLKKRAKSTSQMPPTERLTDMLNYFPSE